MRSLKYFDIHRSARDVKHERLAWNIAFACRARIEARMKEDEKLRVTLRNRDARINVGHSRDGARSDQQAETEMQTPKDTNDAECLILMKVQKMTAAIPYASRLFLETVWMMRMTRTPRT